jgi:hypothetical protein
VTRSGFVVLGLAFAAGIGIAVLPKTSTAAPAPMVYGQNWDDWGMRGLKNDAERRGYKEGVFDGRQDFQMHKPTDPDTHRHYMSPPVPPDVADDYRNGFMRGYTVALSQLEGEPAWTQYRGDPETWQPPSAWAEFKRKGFHDGIEGARKDYGNHRRSDPNNRDEYRNPHTPPEFRHDYREGFLRGYEAAASRLYGM